MRAEGTVAAPADEAEAVEVVRAHAASGTPLRIEGGGTRSGLGRLTQTGATLSASGLTGITLHEPAELVIAARAGTPLAEVEAVLDAAGQRLAFEPIDHRPLLGTTGEPTIGGVVAVNASGPRRIQAGAARDGLIGVRMVTGRGEIVRSGGRVMKNVTGYDFVKLAAGSYGTLGFLTEATFKVLPRPETMATLAIEGLEDAQAVAALSAALGSPYDVTGAAHLPAAVAGGGRARTLVRLEGFGFAVDHRAAMLADMLAGYGAVERLGPDDTAAIWRDVRDVRPLIEPRWRAVWRVSVAPSAGPRLIAALGTVAEAWFYDWGGGLVWLAADSRGDCGAGALRAALKPLGGHATLVRAPDEARASLPVFQPPAEPVTRLTRSLKAAFDPAGILEPGRMYPGI